MTPDRADAYFGGRRMDQQIEIVWLWGAFSNCDGVQVLWGRAGTFPAAGHPFAQLWWAWSGAVATRGVNQEGDHAVGGSDKLATAHVLRPEC